MSVFDIIIILPVLWGIYKGFTKGFIKEIATLVALFIGIYGATKLYETTLEYISTEMHTSEKYLPLIAFGLTFIGIVIIIHLFAKVLDKLIKAVALGIANRIAGAIFGGLKFFLFVAAFLIIVDKIDYETHFLDDNTKENSILYKPTLNLIYKIFPVVDNIKHQDITPNIDIEVDI